MRLTTPQHPDFLDWIDDNKIHEHHGFLWIKGKPGSGKSTIMKETLTSAKQAWPGQVILSHFYNARSPHSLERSSLGLYRSLLHQLSTLLPSNRAPFTTRFASKVRNEHVEVWTEVELQNSLIQLVATPQAPYITIFIDALDEDADDDTRQMVKFLEHLTNHPDPAARHLRICLSSRHYPLISVAKYRSLTIENQAEHDRDIESYIGDQLSGADSPDMISLRQIVREKSEGIFLWVVLVVRILTKPYDQGRDAATVRRRLLTIPPKRHDFFAQILFRNSDDLEECIVLLQWVLFSKRPLRLIELYHAVHYSLSSTKADELLAVALDVATRYLLSCSRGLVELTKTTRSTVQFIHETVRDCLRSGHLFEHEGFRQSFSRIPEYTFEADVCNGKLSETCLNYTLQIFEKISSIEELSDYPVIYYAARRWPEHLESGRSPPLGREVDMATDLLTGSRKRLFMWLLIKYNPQNGYKFTARTPGELSPRLLYAALIDKPKLTSRILALSADDHAQG